MATKKKKSISPKKVSANSSPRRPASRRKILSPVALPVQAAPSGNGFAWILIAVGIAAIAWFLHRRPSSPAPVAAPVALAPAAAGAPPEGRSPAGQPVEIAKPVVATPVLHRASAGNGETGQPSLTFDRSLKQPLSVRCWRTEGGMAQLDIFASRNRLVRSIKSPAGKLGLVELSWDGKNSDGKKVETGLYFLRPTQKDEQSIRDVWVK